METATYYIPYTIYHLPLTVYITEPQVPALLHHVLKRRPRSRNKRIFIGLASGGIIPLDLYQLLFPERSTP